MILSFSSYGKGGGAGPVRYVSSPTKWDKTTRSRAPELVEGDCNYTEKLIDSVSRKYKYTSLSISFTTEEYTPELERKVIAEFKKAAFIGIEADDYDCLIVRHLDTANPHLHIIVPRVHLSSGIDLNIAPPGSQQGFWRAWSTATREKLGLEPIEKKPTLDACPFSKQEILAVGKNHNLPLLQAKKIVDETIRENIANGLLNDRNDVIAFLKANGFEIARITDASISIKTETRNIRLQGGIYERNTTAGRDCNTYAEIARASKGAVGNSGRGKPKTFGKFHHEFANYANRKHNFNQKMYSHRTKSIEDGGRRLLSKSAAKNATNNSAGNSLKFGTVDNRGSSLNEIKQAKTTGQKIIALTAMLHLTKDPVEKGRLLSQIAELTQQAAADFADVMTRMGPRL